MFIDTHCHLTDGYCGDNKNTDIIQRAIDAGVGVMICPTAAPTDIETAIKLSENNNNIFCTIGVHPEYAPTDIKSCLTDCWCGRDWPGLSLWHKQSYATD